MTTSAYDVVRQAGYTGTLEEFIDAIKKEQFVDKVAAAQLERQIMEKLEGNELDLRGLIGILAGLGGSEPRTANSLAEMQFTPAFIEGAQQAEEKTARGQFPDMGMGYPSCGPCGCPECLSEEQDEPAQQLPPGYMEALREQSNQRMQFICETLGVTPEELKATREQLEGKAGFFRPGILTGLERPRLGRPFPGAQLSLPPEVQKFIQNVASKPSQETEQSLMEKGKEAMSQAVNPQIQLFASEKTLQDLVAQIIIPGIAKQFSELVNEFSGQDLLRQQRRLADRQQKLMKYVHSPELIDGNAIADEYELAIYKWFQFKKVADGQLTEQKMHTAIQNATTSFEQRRAEVERVRNKQRIERNRKLVLDEIAAERSRFDSLIKSGEPDVLLDYLQGLVERIKKAEPKNVAHQPQPVDRFVGNLASAVAGDPSVINAMAKVDDMIRRIENKEMVTQQEIISAGNYARSLGPVQFERLGKVLLQNGVRVVG